MTDHWLIHVWRHRRDNVSFIREAWVVYRASPAERKRIAASHDTKPRMLEFLAQSEESEETLALVAGNPHTDPAVLLSLLSCESVKINSAMAGNPNSDPSLLDAILSWVEGGQSGVSTSNFRLITGQLASNESSPPRVLDSLTATFDASALVAANPSTDSDILTKLCSNEFGSARMAVMVHHVVTPAMLVRLATFVPAGWSPDALSPRFVTDEDVHAEAIGRLVAVLRERFRLPELGAEAVRYLLAGLRDPNEWSDNTWTRDDVETAATLCPSAL